MGLFEGKTPTERNKMIAAAVLGVVAIAALYLAFFGGRSAPSSQTTVNVAVKPTSTPGAVRAADVTLPSATEQNFVYQSTPVSYSPGLAGAPDPGRNIFAFYEPPPPCKGADCPTPLPPPIRTPKPPTPAPTPPIQLTFTSPQTVFAGSRSFRLELAGTNIPPEARIYFNQVEMPTARAGADRLYTDIPANLIAQEGPRQIIIQTPDGKLYSNQTIFTVQAPPKPTLTYIGMIARKRGNNDTAYFTEPGKDKPFGARLNDVLSGRFRLIDISSAEVVMEDTSLGFRHRLPLNRTVAASGGAAPTGRMPTGDSNFGQPSFDPNQKGIPGIPDNIPRYVPPASVNAAKSDAKKEDVDDDEIQ